MTVRDNDISIRFSESSAVTDCSCQRDTAKEQLKLDFFSRFLFRNPAASDTFDVFVTLLAVIRQHN